MKFSYCDLAISTCLALIFSTLSLNYQFEILPINGYFLGFYVVAVFVISAWIAFASLQSLLRKGKPVGVDFKQLNFTTAISIIFEKTACTFSSERREKLEHVKGQNLTIQKIVIDEDKDSKLVTQNSINDRIEEFVTDVENRFIIKWYKYISYDKNFPSETRKLLDEIVRRFLQVIVQVDNKKLSYGILTLILNHVKEFRKTVRRVKRNGGSVEEMYRYSHVSSKSPEAIEMYVHYLTTDILKQFINWELYCSLPCKILVSVLARKLFMNMLHYISLPGFLNYKILQTCCTRYNDYDLTRHSSVKLSDVNFEKKNEIESVNISPLENKTVNSQSDSNIDSEKNYKDKVNVADEVDSAMHFKKSIIPKAQLHEKDEIKKKKCNDSEQLSSVTQLKMSEPVKIYKSKPTNRTWRNSRDLQCISLGEDLLELQNVIDANSEIQTLIEKNLWKEGVNEDLPFLPTIYCPTSILYFAPVAAISIPYFSKYVSLSNLELPLRQEEATEEQLHALSKTNLTANCAKAMTNTSALLSNTIKPIGNVTAHTLHNMKEFQQNTVNTVVRPVSQATTNAMHKIENFQDEAAGVVEGILDFGMAGLRKGLRLTGLPDNFSELTNKNKHEQAKDDTKVLHKLTKAPRLKSIEERLKLTGNEGDFEESVWINPLRESPNYDGNILLEKTPEIENSNINNKNSARQEIPQIAEDVLLINDSPDPEYEEAADFATTIAKLRSLLQQKSSESGISTPSLSPMLYDEFNKPPDDSGEVVAVQNEQDISRVDGTMPSLYKFCARTATGVFQNTLNTIKTALPGTINETPQGVHSQSLHNWTFVEVDSFSDDFQSRMEKLISERRAFCTIDTAYEAINSLDVADQPGTVWTPAAAGLELLDDESDEFTSHIPVTKSLVDIFCEILFDSNTCLTQETAVRIFLLLLGTTSENFLNSQSETLLHTINKFIGKLPESFDDNELTIKLDEMIQWCIEQMPRHLPKIFGDKTIKVALKLILSSFQSQKINQHLLIQIFDLCASELILANNKFTPTYSA